MAKPKKGRLAERVYNIIKKEAWYFSGFEPKFITIKKIGIIEVSNIKKNQKTEEEENRVVSEAAIANLVIMLLITFPSIFK